MLAPWFVLLWACCLHICAASGAYGPTKESITHIDGHLSSILDIIHEDSHGRQLGSLGLPKTGLNETCNEKLCLFLESALSCKALGFNFDKLCAKYILGQLYGCTIFPTGAEFYNAPSVCLTQAVALLPADVTDGLLSARAGISGTGEATLESHRNNEEGGEAAGGVGSLLPTGWTPAYTIVNPYMRSNFGDNCKRRCFQRYIEQANNFFDTCTDQINAYTFPSNNTNSKYPLVYSLESFQHFKNQVCVQNQNESNCYDQIQPYLPDYTQGEVIADIDLFKLDCNYHDNAPLNDQALDAICDSFRSAGCCFGNQVALISQSQVNASAFAHHSALKFLPPCLLRYMKVRCNAYVDATQFCTNGSNTNVTTISGKIKMGAITHLRESNVRLVNVYDQDAMITFMGIIVYKLLWNDDSLTKLSSMSVEITDYAYFNSTVQDQAAEYQITPEDGYLYNDPYHGDYSHGVSAYYDFQIVVQGLSEQEGETMLSDFVNKYSCHHGAAGIADTLEVVGSNPTCHDISSSPAVYLANPITPNSAGYRAGGGVNGEVVGCLTIAMAVLSMVWL